MIKFFFTFLLFLTLLFIVSSSRNGKTTRYHADRFQKNYSSVNPPASRTGAPGELNCTSCHIGTTQPANGVIDFSFSGVGNEYVVGETYSITIGIGSGAKNGFQMTILDNTNSKAGTFISGSNTSITNSIGRQYIRQSASVGLNSWTFQWKAPDTDQGDLTIYYSFNKSNALNNTSGDIIYLGQFNLTSAVFNTITQHEKTENPFNFSFHQNKIDYSFTINDNNPVSMYIKNSNGQIVYTQELGNKSPGTYHESVTMKESVSQGLYIISLMVGNTMYTKKIVVAY